tara:strand:- start:207 stop:662 length:456 start_codon:yes stop_codon:yes gene_type:complete
MKAKNILVLGVLIFAIYYLTKEESPQVLDESTDDGDKDLEDVQNGNEPQSLSDDQKLKLFKQATNFYSGGARPTDKLLKDLEDIRNEALKKIEFYKLQEEFEKFKAEQKLKKSKLPPPSSRGANIFKGDLVMTKGVDGSESLGLTNSTDLG